MLSSRMLKIAKLTTAAGATWLCVRTFNEAVALRNRLETPVPILVMGYVDPTYLSVASRNRIIVTAVSLDWILVANKLTVEPFDFHRKLGNGFNRNGCQTFDEVRSKDCR